MTPTSKAAQAMTDDHWDAERLDAAIQDFATVVIMAQKPDHGGMRRELKQTRERIHEIAKSLAAQPSQAQAAEAVDDWARSQGYAAVSDFREFPAPPTSPVASERDAAQLADWLLTDPQTGERLHFAGPLEPDFLRFSRVRMQSKSGATWTLSARLEEGYLTAAERLENIKRATRESE